MSNCLTIYFTIYGEVILSLPFNFRKPKIISVNVYRISTTSRAVRFMLTTRELKLVNKLLKAKNPVRIKDLSSLFQVSTRTIKYDLENVKVWFKDYHVDFHSQSHKGIWIQCDDAKRQELLNEHSQAESKNPYPDQTVRIRKIIRLMLLANDYITASDLAEELDVSRNTILNDLNQVEPYVERWGVSLERKKRTGYKLLGEELVIRLLFQYLLQTDLSNYEIFKIMNRITGMECNGAEGEPPMEESVLAVYKVAEKHLAAMYPSSVFQSFQQSDLVRILTRLTISVIRLNQGFTIKGYKLLDEGKFHDEASLYSIKLLKNVFEEMQFPLFENEYYYISGEIDHRPMEIDLVTLTKEIIQYVSKKEGVEYKKDPNLYSNIFAHLSLRLHKGVIDFTEVNPFTEEIRRDYGQLFSSVKEAFERSLGGYVISNPDSFISYIVLHFIVSLENTFKKRKKVRALYVCSTGKGVARLLKNRVEREIQDIEIVKNCSIMEVDAICKTEEVDLIVSVFPLETEIPLMVVDALPSKSDLDALKEKVQSLLNKTSNQGNSSIMSNEQILGEGPEEISQEIILKSFEVTQEIMSTFNDVIIENRKDALMLHLFLMVHRCYFNKQYDNYLYTNQQIMEKKSEYVEKIKAILNQSDLTIHDAEIVALMQYLQ